QPLPFEETREKFLRQIPRGLQIVALTAHVGVNRTPVSPAKRFQSSRGLGLLRLARRQHGAPVRGAKLAVCAGSCRHRYFSVIPPTYAREHSCPLVKFVSLFQDAFLPGAVECRFIAHESLWI